METSTMNSLTSIPAAPTQISLIAQTVAASVEIRVMPIGFIAVAGVTLIFLLVTWKIISKMLRSVTGQPSPKGTAGGSGLGMGFGVGLILVLLVAVLVGLSTLSTVRETTVTDQIQQQVVRVEAEGVTEEIHESLNEMMQDLSEARTEIQQSMRSHTKPVAIPHADAAAASQESVVVTSTADTIEPQTPDSSVLQATSNSQPVERPAVPESNAAIVVESTEAASSDEPQAAVVSASQPPAEESGSKTEVAAQDQPSSQAPHETAATETRLPDTTTKPETAETSADESNPEPATSEDSEKVLTATDEEMQKKRAEVTARIGQWIRSMVSDSSSAENGSDAAAQAVQSENGDVVVLQLSDEMVGQLLGEKGQEILRSFNSELPGRIRQTYALVPLSAPVDAAVAPMKPLLAAGGLRDIANSLVRMLDQADEHAKSKNQLATNSASTESGTAIIGTDTAAASTETQNGELAVEPALKPMPAWIKNPEGRRLVAQTAIILPGDDSEELLLDAVNEALGQHLQNITESSDPEIRRQAAIATLKLDSETSKKCIVETWERTEIIDSEVAGPTEARRIYALVEFPESIDTVAFEKLRRSLQIHRVAAVSGSMVLAWLAVCSFGCSVRLGRKGSRLRRLLAAPFFGLLALPLLLGGITLLLVTVSGNPSSPPFLPEMESLVIRMDSPSAVSISR
jgi:hypothetical protein